MKTARISLAITAAILMLLPACKKFEIKTEDMIFPTDFSIIRTSVNFDYIDASTEKMIPGSSSGMKVQVVSPIKGLIINATGKYQTEFTPKHGFLTFSLNPFTTIPTSDQPIKLLIKKTSDDFLESTKTIGLSEERNYNQKIRLINTKKLPEGFMLEDYKDAGKMTSAGVTTEKIALTSKKSEVNLQIEAGTSLKDEAGRTLSGNISVKMISVDVSNAKGYKNVPAIGQPMVTEGGRKSGLYSPIAYTKLEIRDGSGLKATSLAGKDMVIKTAVKSNVINPKTNKAIAVGDLVPSYYFDGKDGNWKSLGNDVVTEEKGQLQLIKVIKAKKSTGDEIFGEFGYSFDEDMPIDIQLVINLSEPKPLLPTTFNTIIEGINSLGEAIELFNGNVTQSTLSQTFTFNAMNPGYSTYRMKLTNADMIEANGATQQKTNSQLSASNNQFTFDLAADQFKNPGDFDGPTKLFIQFSCVPSSGNPLSMDSPYLPGNFHLIVSGTGFDGETVLQVQDGSLIFPFNPVLQDGGVWQVKVIMGDLEFPAGDSRVTIPSTFFQLIDGKVVFGYSLESTSQCDEFKRALGLD